MRVVIADDTLLVREGIASLLRRAGFEVVAEAGSAEELEAAVDTHEPAVALVDIRMPPTFTDEGLRAAAAVRSRHPRVGIMILSQHVDVGVAMRALAEDPAGPRLPAQGPRRRHRGLRGRAPARRRRRLGPGPGGGGGAARLPAGRTRTLAALSSREREVLGLVAEGLSNRGIAERLVITAGAVQKHVTAIFTKLGLPGGDDANRRVLAVLAYLDPARPRATR